MAHRSPPPAVAKPLARAAAAYQAAEVIPHCPQCQRPCCKLDTLVLELNWPQVRTLWQLRESRAAFDQRLASGHGPIEIRPANGRYYAHQKPCPAYDDARPGCRVYDQDTKPVGCSDFPVYENEGSVMADLRCEAVDLKRLTAQLQEALGPDVSVRTEADPTFPFLVTLTPSPARKRRRKNFIDS